MDIYLEKCRNQLVRHLFKIYSIFVYFIDISLNQLIVLTFQTKLNSVSEEIELVIGNESCDLDSAVSAVGLAFIKYTEYDVSNRLSLAIKLAIKLWLNFIVLIAWKQESDNKRIVIPVLNITRNELVLKTEVIFWFENSIHLNRNDLICRDQIDFEALKTS